MKLSSALLALCAVQQATAFVVQTPKTQTALNANSFDYLGGGGPPAPAAGQESSAAARFVQGAGPGDSSAPAAYGVPKRPTQELWDEVAPVIVQGGSLRTCSFDESVDRVQVLLKTEGRPLNANVDLWQGPDNTPQKMAVYLEDGLMRPFRAIVETPGATNTISILNTGQIEYPLTAGIEALSIPETLPGKGRIVQGGAVYTTPFAPSVESVQIKIETDGRPMTCRVELLQGPNNIKQVMEIYLEDGMERPFNLIMDTPGAGNVVRIQNTATIEYPLHAAIEPYMVGAEDGEGEGGMTWR